MPTRPTSGVSGQPGDLLIYKIERSFLLLTNDSKSLRPFPHVGRDIDMPVVLLYLDAPRQGHATASRLAVRVMSLDRALRGELIGCLPLSERPAGGEGAKACQAGVRCLARVTYDTVIDANAVAGVLLAVIVRLRRTRRENEQDQSD